MPFAGRWLLFAASIVLIAAIAACGGPSLPADRLLGPEDFPGVSVTVTDQETAQTAVSDGASGTAVQAVISGPGWKLLQSMVFFESHESARSVLAGIKEDMAALGFEARPANGFQDISGTDPTTNLDGEPASTLFFVEANVLVRLTVSGVDREALLMDIAEKARAKTDR